MLFRSDRTVTANSRLPKAPTKEERDDRRKRGLCMWCGQKFVYGYQCARSQLYHLLVDDEDNSLPEMEQGVVFEETADNVVSTDAEDALKPVISLHALLGTGDS